MIADYATTGLTVHRHPLRLLRPGLKARGTVTSADLEAMRHGATVSIGGLVVARQRPGTAKGVVFLLIEDETGTVNIIVPPRVYERDRLTVRTEPLVLVEGTLERHAAAGGAINVLVKRLVPLDAADLRTERPAATVKDFSPLDERERQRILEEQPLVAVGGGGADSAAPMPGTARTGALAAVASSGGDGGRREADGGSRANRCSFVRRRLDLQGGGYRWPGPWLRPQQTSRGAEAGRRCRGDLVARRRSPGVEGSAAGQTGARRGCRGTRWRGIRESRPGARGLRGLPRRRPAGHELRAGTASMTGMRVPRLGTGERAGDAYVPGAPVCSPP